MRLAHITGWVTVLTILVLLILLPVQKTNAQLFSPFGGKVQSWLPQAPACTAVTTTISVLTGGTVNMTIEELKVGNPKGGTFGLIKINGIPAVPPPTNIHAHRAYQVPGNWVLGMAFNPCKACNVLKDIPLLEQLCSILGASISIPIIGKVSACSVAGSGCPLTNVIWRIGSSLTPF